MPTTNSLSDSQTNELLKTLIQEVQQNTQVTANLQNIIFRGYVVHKDIREMDDLNNELDSEITI